MHHIPKALIDSAVRVARLAGARPAAEAAGRHAEVRAAILAACDALQAHQARHPGLAAVIERAREACGGVQGRQSS